jgi:Zn-dependent M28 family amino/carboxypeptidase
VPQRRLLDRLASAVDRQRLRRDLEALAAPRHRLSAPESTAQAERQIQAWLREAGWNAERQEFGDGVNLVAVREGDERPALGIVAHHDTVAGSGGADDNGSGVIGLVELARLLAPFRFRRAIVLATVDLEETGRFQGTEALIAALGSRIAGAIVFESLAFTDPRPGSQHIPPGLGVLYPQQLERARRLEMAATWTLLVYRRSGLPLARAFGDGFAANAGPDAALLVRDPLDLPLLGRLLPYAVPTIRHFARSDHVAFWRHGIPAILLTDTADMRNLRYHTPFDLPASLDYDRLTDTVVATAFAICRLAGGRPINGDAG